MLSREPAPDHVELAICRRCANLSGCTLLTFAGHFEPALVLSEKNKGECDDFAEASQRELRLRKELIKRMGPEITYAALHAHVRDQLEEPEKEEEEPMTEVPDFIGMIRPGMTPTERTEQLKYETDDNGNVFIDPDLKGPRIRSSFAIRKYAMDPDGPAKLPKAMATFLKPDELIKLLLKAEKDAGWIQKGKRTKAGNEEDTSMGKPIVISNRSKATKVPAKEVEAEDEAPKKASKVPAKAKAAATVTGKATAKVAPPATGGKKVAKVESAVPSKAKKGDDSSRPVTLADLAKGLTILHDAIFQKLNDQAARQDAALGQIDGVDSEIFSGPREGRKKEAKIDFESLLAQELTIFSYTDAADPEDAAEDEEEDEEDEEDEDEGEDEDEEDEEDE